MSKKTMNKSYEEYYFTKEKNISNFELTRQQKECFDKAYKVLKNYGYQKGNSILSTQLDHMTLIAFGATPCGIYFRPMNYVVEISKDKLSRLLLFFLTKYDLDIAGEHLKNPNLGYTETYNSMYVTTLETIKTSYSTNRALNYLNTKNVDKVNE